MILVDDARFAYVHIPKCAGTTIRNWLSREGVPFDRRFSDYLDVPGIGRYHGAHLTLRVLRGHMPDVFARLTACDSVTVVRDPLPRFASAFAQQQRQFHGRNVALMPPAEIRAALGALLARLAAGEAERDTTLMHFLPQADFIELDGVQVVGTVHAIEDLDRLVAAIAARFGLTSRPEAANQRRAMRVPWLARPAHQAKRISRAVLPEALWRPLHDAALRRLTRRRESDDDFVTDDIRAFVAEHYARDRAIHAAARARTAAA